MVKIWIWKVLELIKRLSILLPSAVGFLINILIFKFLPSQEYLNFTKYQILTLVSTYLISNSCYDSKIKLNKSIKSNFNKIFLLNIAKNAMWAPIILIAFILLYLVNISNDYLIFFSVLIMIDYLQPQSVILLANQKRFKYIYKSLTYNLLVISLILLFTKFYYVINHLRAYIVLFTIFFLIFNLYLFKNSKLKVVLILNSKNLKYNIFKFYNNSFELTIQGIILLFLPKSIQSINLFIFKQTSILTLFLNSLVSSRYKMAMTLTLKMYFIQHIKYVSKVFIMTSPIIISFILLLTLNYNYFIIALLSCFYLVLRLVLAFQQIEYRLIEIGIFEPIFTTSKVVVLCIIVFFSFLNYTHFFFEIHSLLVYSFFILFSFIYVFPTFKYFLK